MLLVNGIEILEGGGGVIQIFNFVIFLGQENFGKYLIRYLKQSEDLW